ncbi:MAG: phage terminase large subunit family protein [Terrimicrobiaceae bacterium]
MREKNKKTRKIVSGVPVRPAWAGSANQLKSDPAVLAIVDEHDGMAKNIKGEGDPVRLPARALARRPAGRLASAHCSWADDAATNREHRSPRVLQMKHVVVALAAPFSGGPTGSRETPQPSRTRSWT